MTTTETTRNGTEARSYTETMTTTEKIRESETIHTTEIITMNGSETTIETKTIGNIETMTTPETMNVTERMTATQMISATSITKTINVTNSNEPVNMTKLMNATKSHKFWISVSKLDETKLVDNDTNTWVIISHTPDIPQVKYSLAVNGYYGKMVTIVIPTTNNCETLRSVLLVERQSPCGNNTILASKCELMSAEKSMSQTMCHLKCKCADSADQCWVRVYSGLVFEEVVMCEIFLN